MKRAILPCLLPLAFALLALAACTAPAVPTAAPSPLAATPSPFSSATPAPTATATLEPTLTPTPTATVPQTLYNRYVGKDPTRQPELIKTPPAPVIPIHQAEGYARSSIAIFLSGNQVNGEVIRGDPAMLVQLIRLYNDAFKQQHVSETVLSGYRTYDDQVFLGQKYKVENDNYLAVPGRSEHHLGTVVDVAWETDRLDFYVMNADPKARAFYNWLKENAQNYGFIFSYPYKTNADQTKNNLLEPYVTEYKAEPWHIRFVGLELAQKIYTTRDAQGRNYLDPLSPLLPQQFLVP